MKFSQTLGLVGLSCIILAGTSCKTGDGPKLIFKYKFDSTQTRLNNIGQVSTIPAGHAAQSPRFNEMSSHYIELAPSALTALGAGEVIYLAPQTSAGGSAAIDFDQSVKAGNGEEFFSIPIKDVAPGTYEWIRVSLAYQNYDIDYRIMPPVIPTPYSGSGTLASFIGFNTYITNFTIATTSQAVNANRLQGFWGFESTVPVLGPQVAIGQAPPGATTVPNPIFASSPVPQGSCVVTGPFSGQSLVITGNETEDIVITISLSTNKSFEWKESGGNNLYEPLNGDTVVDMGIRGLIPIIE